MERTYIVHFFQEEHSEQLPETFTTRPAALSYARAAAQAYLDAFERRPFGVRVRGLPTPVGAVVSSYAKDGDFLGRVSWDVSSY